MIEEDQYCGDILTQVAAVYAATNMVGNLILKNHSVACIENIVSAEYKEKAMSQLTKTIQSFMRFSEQG